MRHTKLSKTSFALALVCAACGSTPPPKELIDARTAYQRASTGPAAELNPAQLHVAQQTLQRAEAAFQDDPGSPETRDMAYVAQRKAELAESQARAAMAAREKAQALRDTQNVQGQFLQRTQGELSQTREQLATHQQQLAVERQARLDAERKAQEAMANIAKIAAVKEEQRGTVITLSGSVLFASGKSDLLPAAQIKLDQVAEALREQERPLVVEGHTDSQGDAGFNMQLSQRRAEAVRSYLVGRGIPADQIRAQGHGSTRPVAENTSPEGRANNRRVEIVVEGGKR